MNQSSNKNKPTTLVIHGANALGIRLTELLVSQKSNVVVIDEFTKQNKNSVHELKKKYDADVYDTSAMPSLSEEMKRLDYVFILVDRFLSTNPTLNSKRFLSETNLVDAAFKMALDRGAKVVLTTSISLHRQIIHELDERTDTLKDVSKQTPYTPVELQRYAENLAAEYHDQAALDVRITRVGEVIGQGIPLDSPTIFQQMIKDAITKPRISIPGEGLDYAYYVHILDAVYGIVKSLFSAKTNGEVYSLSYDEEISSLNLAYKILEMNPRANEIVFAETDEETHPHKVYVPAKNLTKLGWTPKISFEKALHETMDYFHTEYKVAWKEKPSFLPVKKTKPTPSSTKPPEHSSESVTPFGKVMEGIATPFSILGSSVEKRLSGKKERKLTPGGVAKTLGIIAVCVVIFFGLVGPLLQVISGTAGTYYFGKRGYDAAVSLETETAEKSLEKAVYSANLMQEGWKSLRWIKIIPPARSFYEETSRLTSAASHLTTGSHYLAQGMHPYAEYFKSFEPITSFGPSAGGGSREYLQELEAMEEGIPYIEQASVEISLAREALDGVDTSVYPASLSNRIDQLTDKAESANTAVTTLESFAYYLPELLGKNKRQTYVILFQNPMELRSTGGWLTSVGIVGIEHGQIRELEVKDVYEIDGQINQPIDPPASMTEALDVTEWTLSLSNWHPDFPQSAESAEYFLKLTDEVVAVDGVVAIDLEFVRDLIDIWGSVSVPGETDAVTSDNLYDKVIEIHREFTPGSTQKPAFLSNLANEILQKTLSSPKDYWTAIAEKVTTNLDEKHILMYVHNTQIREVLDNNDWSGHIVTQPNQIFPVEWNWGGNKANHFINRSVEYTADVLSESTVNQTMTVTLQNTSTVNRYPEGDYENYVRIYVPEGSRISRVEGLSTVRISNDTSTGMDVVSGWITVPISSRSSYSISYQVRDEEVEDFALERNQNGEIEYQLNFLKQPGLIDDPLTIDVTYPEGWTPTDLTNVQRELNSLVRRTSLTTDVTFSISWEN